MKYFHGTPREIQGLKVLQEGLLPDLSTTQGVAKPVAGRVYLSKNIDYAIIYLLGANMLGSKLPDNLLTDRFGYLFVVEEEVLGSVQPDEDQVGEAMASGEFPQLEKYQEFLIDQEPIDNPEGHYQNLWQQVKEGEYVAWIKAGHLLLPKLSEIEKMAIINHYGNIAHEGKVIPSEAWKFDKTLSEKLRPDGSNFFQLAQRVL